jgi:cysteinyl-tRNA synthetase
MIQIMKRMFTREKNDEKVKLYNTLTRKKEKLTKKEVGMYACGPTVYHYAHIGNLRSYIFEDILKRVLLFNGVKVKHVMNITDVGHLTSDSDTGEDKMLKGARREKKTVWEIAEFYTDAFKRDVKKLNIIKPDIWCKATDHIKEQIEMIQQLEKKGFTYTAGGNVYFDTSKLKDYGKLARLDLEAETKERVEKDPHKKNKHDFVLWFTKSKFLDQEMKWKSPYGEGYPGWHIECSAMASKYLGEQFDIHCGGHDLIPVHHTNEIAQSEAAFGKKPWVKFWIHSEFLVLPTGDKMAKSGDNFLTLSVLSEKGIDALDYRYFCLGTHYRNPLMFGYEALEGARTGRKKLVERVLELKGKGKVSKKYLDMFNSEVSDDLNTPKALAVMWEVVKSSMSDGDKYVTLLKFDEVLGLGLKDLKVEKIPSEILKLAKEREKARSEKDWKKSDELRDEISKKGYLVEDGKDGFEIRVK